MNKGQRYDQMVVNPTSDRLGLFDNYLEIMELAQNRIRKILPNKIFDIGCGTGNLCGPLSSNIEVIGIDQSEEMLTQASLKYPLMKTICSDLNKLNIEPLPSSEELVTCSYVLHGVKDKALIFEWFDQAIQNGSMLLIIDYIFDSEKKREEYIEKLIKEGKIEEAHVVSNKWYMTREGLELWINQNNYKSIQIQINHWIWLVEIRLNLVE